MKKVVLFVLASFLLGGASWVYAADSKVNDDSVIVVDNNAGAPDKQQTPKKKLVIEVPGQGMNSPTSAPSAYCDQGEGDCSWWKVALMNAAFGAGHAAMQ